MNWHTAHKNKQRVLARRRRKQRGWKFWLKEIGVHLIHQNLIHEDSLYARLVARAGSYRSVSHLGAAIPFPRFSEGFAVTAEGSPAPATMVHYRTAWRSLWEGQGRKCAECGIEIPLEESAKKTHSFEVICRACYAKKPPMFIIVDDIDEAVGN